MAFTPKSEEELKNDMLFPAGNYDFIVDRVERRNSSSGNDMLVVDLKVSKPDGFTQYVTDYLVAADKPLCLLKLRHYCESVGNIEAYESGDIGNFPGEGASGVLTLKVEHSDTWGDQNKVADYVSRESPRRPQETNQLQGANPSQLQRAKVANDGDIPF